MASIKIPTPLRQYTGNQAEVTVRGATVDEGLRDLVARYPALEPHLFDGEGLRSFVNIYLGGEDIRFLQDLDTPLAEDSRLRIIPAIAGGAGVLTAPMAFTLDRRGRPQVANYGVAGAEKLKQQLLLVG